MKIIKAGYEILTPLNGILKSIEIAGRVCYKSEDKITETSCIDFVKMIIARGHEAMLEHGAKLSVKFTCDRGVSHEIVRHRLFSFAQESTRYCNYSKDKFGNEITVIEPCFWDSTDKERHLWSDGCDNGYTKYGRWLQAMKESEKLYFDLIKLGAKPEEARSVLPNSLKTEIVVTGNIREWRHFFKLRTAKVAHPQMREITIPLLKELQSLVSVIFDDIKPEE